MQIHSYASVFDAVPLMPAPAELTSGATRSLLQKNSEGQRKLAEILKLVDGHMESLLRHDYFQACRAGALGRSQMVTILQQLYCFSRLFERLITRRLATLSPRAPESIIDVARQHIRDEIGHPAMFRRVLLDLGMTREECNRLVPSAHTMALYGYMLVLMEDESEIVFSVAMFQFLEAAGFQFFNAMLPLIAQIGEARHAFVEHAEHDAGHEMMGLEDVILFDEQVRVDCQRVLPNLFCLAENVLKEWMLM